MVRSKLCICPTDQCACPYFALLRREVISKRGKGEAIPKGWTYDPPPKKGWVLHNPRRRSLTRVTKYVAFGGETKTSFRGNSNAFGGKSISSFEVIQRPSAGCFHPCALASSERFHRSESEPKPAPEEGPVLSQIPFLFALRAAKALAP